MPKLAQTPGTVLKSLLDEYQLSTAKLAQAIGLSNSAVYQITIGKTRVSAPVALRLAKYFGQTPAYWLELQAKTDLAEAAGDAKLSAVVKGISKGKKPKAPKVAIKAGKTAKAAGAKKAPAKKAAGKAATRKAPAKKTAKKSDKAAAPKKPAVILIKKTEPEQTNN